MKRHTHLPATSETRVWGYSYGDILQIREERDRYKHALLQIVSGEFPACKPPRDIRGARKIALEAVVDPK